MKVIEILKLSRNFLETLQKSCIKVEDCKYIDLYDEYNRILESGCKATYAVAVLSEVYGISERKVYYIIKKLKADCKVDAV